MVIEILGPGRPLEVRRSFPNRVSVRRGRDTSQPSCRARIMPVATSPLRRPSRTSSRCRWRVAVPHPSGRRPAEIVTSFAQRSGWRAAKTTPTMPPRLAPTHVTGISQPQPSSHAATRSASPATEIIRAKRCRTLPRRSVAGPGRTEHRCASRDRSCPARTMPATTARADLHRSIRRRQGKRRRGDAAGRSTPPARCQARVRRPSRRSCTSSRCSSIVTNVIDDQPPRNAGRWLKSGHRGIV